jgi:hypothetical protein
MLIELELMFLAALCIVPTLFFGAVSDVKWRIFPKDYWNWPGKIAGIIVFIEYLVMVSNQEYASVGFLLGISIILSVIFYTCGLVFGSGGDWRALIYIVWITPTLIAGTVFFALIIGAVQGVYAMLQPEDEIEPAPIMFRTVPFAVAICGGYICAIILGIYLAL